MPEVLVTGPFSLGVGGFADFLLLDSDDFPPDFTRRRLDAGPLAAAFLRYGQIEIQARYQWSLTPFFKEPGEPTLYYQSFSLGLAYYFPKKTEAKTPAKN